MVDDKELLMFFGLAHMLDVTELLTFFGHAHTLDATELLVLIWACTHVGCYGTALRSGGFRAHVGCYGGAHVSLGFRTCCLLRNCLRSLGLHTVLLLWLGIRSLGLRTCSELALDPILAPSNGGCVSEIRKTWV